LDLILPRQIHIPPTAIQLLGASISEWSAKKLTNPAVKDAAPIFPTEVVSVIFPDPLLVVVDITFSEEVSVDVDVGVLLEADCAAVVEVLTEEAALDVCAAAVVVVPATFPPDDVDWLSVTVEPGTVVADEGSVTVLETVFVDVAVIVTVPVIVSLVVPNEAVEVSVEAAPALIPPSTAVLE
jgi:hypothetical protein